MPFFPSWPIAQLHHDSHLADVAAAAWLDGFLDGALTEWHHFNAARNSGAA
jgi:hypothetical protein